MSILQQGHSQGELCVADFCEEGVAVREGMKGVVRRRGERLFCIIQRNGRVGSDEFVTGGAMLQTKMKLVYNWLDGSNALGTRKLAMETS